MRVILLFGAVIAGGLSQAVAVEQKNDLRGARPGMTVAAVVATVTAAGGTCGDGLDINTSFIRGDRNYRGNTVIHQPYSNGQVDTGTVFCTFPNGMKSGYPTPQFATVDKLMIITTMSSKSNPDRTTWSPEQNRMVRQYPSPSWDDIQEAKALYVQYEFISPLDNVEMTNAILKQFGKTPKDVRGIPHEGQLQAEPPEVLLADGNIVRRSPQIPLGADFDLNIDMPRQIAGQNSEWLYTLSISNNAMMRSFIATRQINAAQQRRAIPAPKL